MASTKVEADRCWRSGVQLMAVGVGGEVSGDKWAIRELRTITRGDSAMADDLRPRRMFLSPNFESIVNTRQPITDALCSSTFVSLSSLRTACHHQFICQSTDNSKV